MKINNRKILMQKKKIRFKIEYLDYINRII